MAVHIDNGILDGSSLGIHEFYMTILNSIPSIIYWVDAECQLKGCNNNFVTLLSLKKMRDFKGTPYQQMKKFTHWPDELIERFRLDDMGVIFSGKAQYNCDEYPIQDNQGNTLYFQSTRIPLYDFRKKIAGLIVVLTDVTLAKVQEDQHHFLPLINAHLETNFNEGATPNVLMVEDNLIAQHIEKDLLTALHCNVDIAPSGDNALKLFNPGKYNLVLLDIGLEDMSGYVVAKKFREMEKNTQFRVPIIALTGYEADVVKEDCSQYSMEGVVTEPLTSQQAEQIVKHYIYHLDVPIDGLKHN